MQHFIPDWLASLQKPRARGGLGEDECSGGAADGCGVRSRSSISCMLAAKWRCKRERRLSLWASVGGERTTAIVIAGVGATP